MKQLSLDSALDSSTMLDENVDSTNAPVKYRNIPYNSLSVFLFK